MARANHNDLLLALLKNNVGESSLPSIREGDGPPSKSQSFCGSSKNSSVGDFDDSESHTTGIRSPSGPMRGRTVKEFEDQLTNLKKENFNLKLRIYFLEEKMGTNFTLDKNNIVKKNIELQVEIANLQKEVKEKHDLLCQAVKAIEIEEEEHRKSSQSKDEQVRQLQQELEELRLQIQEKHQIQLANFVYDRSEGLKQQIETLQRECLCKDQTINSLNRELSSANERLTDYAQQINDYEDKLASQQRRSENLMAKLKEEQKVKEKFLEQSQTFEMKFKAVKASLDEERSKFEREKMNLQRMLWNMETRLSMRENEKMKLMEQQAKLEVKLGTAMADVKKSQNIAVSIDPDSKRDTSNTDDRFISASSPTASHGAAEAKPLHVQIKQEQPAGGKGKSSSKAQVPPTPDGKNLCNFEKLLTESGDTEIIRIEFAALKSDFLAQKQKIVKLKSEQLKACEIIKNMIDCRNKANEEIAQLKKAKEELEKEMENMVSKPQKDKVNIPIQTRLSELNITAVGTPPCENTSMAEKKPQSHQERDEQDILGQYKQLTVELEAKNEVLVQTLKEKDSQMEYLRSYYDEVLKQNGVTENFDSLLEIVEKRSMAFFECELEKKNEEIKRLNNEIERLTSYIQQIVNKELWSKNKECEKMYKAMEELSKKNIQLNLLKQKISELELDNVIPSELRIDQDCYDTDYLSSLKRHTKFVEHILQKEIKDDEKEKEDKDEKIMELEKENFRLQCDLEHYHDLEEVCALMSRRLEELAMFLDSLLQEKTVLGCLGVSKNKKLREIIDNSLDLSRSFSKNMSSKDNWSRTLAEMTEYSVQEDTHYSIIPDMVTLKYGNLLNTNKTNIPDSEQVIAALREQVFKLQNELQVRDHELIRLQHDAIENNKGGMLSDIDEIEDKAVEKKTLSPVKAARLTALRKGDRHEASDSDDWSEPDRDVSKARIGLSRSLPPTYVPLRLRKEDSSDFDSDRAPSRSENLQQEIDRLEQEVYSLRQEVEKKADKMSKLEEHGNVQRNHLREQHETERNIWLEEKEQLQTKIENMAKEVEELMALKEKYKEQMEGKDKEMQDKINNLELEKQKILTQCEDYRQQAVEAENKCIAAEEKLKKLEERMEKVEGELRKDYEKNLITKLKNAEEVFSEKIKAVEEKCEADVRIAQETLRLIKEEYAREYVKKAEVETRLNEAEKIMKELSNLKSVVQSYDDTISSYREKEKEINQKIKTYEEAIAGLKSELERASAKCHQLEEQKSKVSQEKQTLEHEIARVSQKEQDLREKLSEIDNNLSEVTNKYGEQVTTLQKQKTNLELKISELESCNAELHNRLVKAQASRFSLGLNATLPPHVGSSRPSYRRHFSDQNSFEDVADDLPSFGISRSPPQVNAALQPAIAEANRAEANTSPDLGIESDHGRFSSLETNGNNVIPRPLLQTIELTESMNNLFDGQGNIDAGTNTSAEHCCQKSIEIAQENNELKRKLLRMKRALEETATQLSLANQRKKQVEKSICKQIHKTSQVLRKAKANLDSGSESDVFRS